MNNGLIEGAVTIGSLIIGIAALSVILSPKARTSQVIQAVASGFSNSLAVAESPVTGERVRIDTSYPDSGGFGGLPALNFGNLPLSY